MSNGRIPASAPTTLASPAVAAPTSSQNRYLLSKPVQARGGLGGNNDPAANNLQQQASRIACGRAFYQNGDNWVDTDVQKHTNSVPTRLQFGSDAYFSFAANNKSLAPVLSLGANVEFVHEGKVIQIVK